MYSILSTFLAAANDAAVDALVGAVVMQGTQCENNNSSNQNKNDNNCDSSSKNLDFNSHSQQQQHHNPNNILSKLSDQLG